MKENILKILNMYKSNIISEDETFDLIDSLYIKSTNPKDSKTKNDSNNPENSKVKNDQKYVSIRVYNENNPEKSIVNLKLPRFLIKPKIRKKVNFYLKDNPEEEQKIEDFFNGKTDSPLTVRTDNGIIIEIL